MSFVQISHYNCITVLKPRNSSLDYIRYNLELQ